jgi:Ca2+/Na+ antiporter
MLFKSNFHSFFVENFFFLLMKVYKLTIESEFKSLRLNISGFSFGIPDSVMGLTFLAAGTSVPEMASSLVVAKQGTDLIDNILEDS